MCCLDEAAQRDDGTHGTRRSASAHFQPFLCSSVKTMLRERGWSEEGHLFAYLYALAVSSYAFSKCASAPFMGYLSDRVGRRKTLTFTLLATAAMLFLTGQCSTFSSLLICRVVAGLFSNGGLLTAYGTDLAVTLKDRNTLFSYFISAWAFARVTAAYIFTCVGGDIGICCFWACVCEVRRPAARLAPLVHQPSPFGCANLTLGLRSLHCSACVQGPGCNAHVPDRSPSVSQGRWGWGSGGTRARPDHPSQPARVPARSPLLPRGVSGDVA